MNKLRILSFVILTGILFSLVLLCLGAILITTEYAEGKVEIPIEIPTVDVDAFTHVAVEANLTNPNIDAKYESIVLSNPTEVFVVEEPEVEDEYVVNNYSLYENRYDHNIRLTEEEALRLAALVQAEADNIYECRLAIASIVINRMMFHGQSFYDVIYAEGQFVTDWGTIAYAPPTEESIEAVYDVLQHGTTLPVYVLFYRAECYHDWNDQTPYINIGNSYFSYSAFQRADAEQRFNLSY